MIAYCQAENERMSHLFQKDSVSGNMSQSNNKKHDKEPLRIPLDFDEALSDLLKVKPNPEVKKEKKKDAPKK